MPRTRLPRCPSLSGRRGLAAQWRQPNTRHKKVSFEKAFAFFTADYGGWLCCNLIDYITMQSWQSRAQSSLNKSEHELELRLVMFSYNNIHIINILAGCLPTWQLVLHTILSKPFDRVSHLQLFLFPHESSLLHCTLTFLPHKGT